MEMDDPVMSTSKISTSSDVRRSATKQHKKKTRKKKKYLFEKIEEELKQIRFAQRARRRRDRCGRSPHGSNRSDALPTLGGDSTKIKTLKDRKEEIKRAEEATFLAEKRRLRSQLTILRKKFNKLKHQSDLKRAEFRDLQNKVLVMDREALSAGKNSELRRHIAEEEKKLEETEARAKEIQLYDRVLKHMEERLWSERHTYEKTLRSYEEVIKIRRNELIELTDVVANAQHMREEARQRLEQMQRQSKGHIAYLEAELKGREELYQNRKDASHMFTDIASKDVSDDKEESKEPAGEKREDAPPSTTTEDADRGEAEGANELMRAFEKIQSVTGMSTEDDIVQNFNSRDIILSELDAKIDMLR
eukprot:g1110.t1